MKRKQFFVGLKTKKYTDRQNRTLQKQNQSSMESGIQEFEGIPRISFIQENEPKGIQKS